MKCPTCFHHLSAGPRITFRCDGSCSPAAHQGATEARGFAATTKPVFQVELDLLRAGGEVRCPRCNGRTEQEACGWCGSDIPAGWRQATVTCIALAGARATGKSLTLAVAKEQLGLLVERHFGSTLRPVGDTQIYFENHYASSLYEQRKLLAPTASMAISESSSRQSMTFQYTERRPDEPPRARIVVLRDVAGEDLETRGGMDSHLTFFERADAVIALIDPLAVRQIREMLADLIPGDTRIGGDGNDVLHYVLDLMNGHRTLGRTSIPIGVVLSKFDTLQALREVEGTDWAMIMNRPGAPLQRDPSLRTPHYDDVDGELLHEEVRGLLERLRAGQLDHVLSDRAERYRFFAVSALGASPRGELVNAGGIAPFRVLDPFKWALEVTG